jgi:hypothetical protein
MSRSHKYLKKYRNSHGKWTYVYKYKSGKRKAKKTSIEIDYSSDNNSSARSRAEEFLKRWFKRVKEVDADVQKRIPKGI